MPLEWLSLKLKNFYLASLVLLGMLWILDVPVRLNIGIVTASYISLMLAVSIAAGFLLKPSYEGRSAILLDVGPVSYTHLRAHET